MDVFNSFLAAVAPRAALNRAVAKKRLEMLNSGYGNYGASTSKKSMKGWFSFGGSPKADIEDNLEVLRERSRDAYMGVPIAAAALKVMRTNVIAGGLMPSPKIDSDFLKLNEQQAADLRADIMREFSLWADTPDCDADRVDSFYQLQQLAFLGCQMNGDSIVLLPIKSRAGQPYDLRVKVLEADRVCSPDGYDRLSPCEVNGRRVHRIVQGVETDQGGETIAFWICSAHPLESAGNELRWTRVKAYGERTGRKNVLHIMHRERAGQVRGVPLLSPVLESIKQLGRYTDAEITAAVVSSMFTAFVKPESASGERPFGETAPDEPYMPDEIKLGSGAIVDLNPGDDVVFADPKHPNSGYDAFAAAITRQIGAALEIPHEILTKQFTTSYSAARGALNEFWRTCEMQRDWFIDDFCQPIYEEWFSEAVAKGRISAPGFFDDPAVRKAYTACSWNGPARTNLNPIQEVQAAILRCQSGFSTAQEETAQMTGGSYMQNMRQRITELEVMRKAQELEGDK